MASPTAGPARRVLVLGCLSHELVCEVEVDARSDVMDVKAQIEAKTGTAQPAQWLFHKGRRLANHEELGHIFEEGTRDENQTLKQAEPELGLVKVDPEWVKICNGMEYGTLRLQDAEEEHRSDPNVVLAALCWSGMSLEHAAEPLRATREIALAAVRQNGLALQFASENLRADIEVVLAAVRSDGLALEFAAEELRASQEVAIAAVRRNGFALRFVSELLHDDRDVVLEAVKSDGRALSYASPELRRDREIVVAACADNNECTAYVPPELMQDPQVLKAWMKGIRVGGDMGGVVSWGVDIQKTVLMSSMELELGWHLSS